MINQFDVVLVALDPTIGSEIQKTRPCVVVSPDDINHNLSRVIVAPMTSKSSVSKFRVMVTFNKVNGLILLDQIRTIDKKRVIKKSGHIDTKTSNSVREVLLEMFG